MLGVGDLSLYAVGLFFILLCDVLWAGSSVLIQFIFEELGFRSPILLTYVATSLLALHLPSHHCLARSKTAAHAAESPGYKELFAEEDPRTDQRIGIDQRRLVKGALAIAPLWFLSNCLYSYSLMMTSVSSSTVISNLAASFTLLFSWQSGLENFAISKVAGVVICFAGAVVVGLDDDENGGKGSLAGDVFALLSAAGYGLYTTLIKFYFDNEEETPMQLALGYIGAVNMLGLLIPVLVMVLVKTPLMGHINGVGIGFVALDGVFSTVIADFCWAKAILYTSPTIATIGTSMTIPLAMITDFFVQGIAPTGTSIGGAILVIVGFILVNVEDQAWVDLLRRLKLLRPVVVDECELLTTEDDMAST